MQLFEKVQEHINHFEFSQAIEKCRMILNGDPKNFEVNECLIELLQQNSAKDFYTHLKQFLNTLKDDGEYQKFYEYFTEYCLQDYKFDFSLQIFYLESIWNLGQIKYFFEQSKKLHALCFDEKYYHHLPKFYSFLETYSKTQTFVFKGRVILACELADYKTLEELLGTYYKSYIFQAFKKDKENFKLLKEISKILSLYKSYSHCFYKEFLKSKLALKLHEPSYQVDRKERLDFFLLSECWDDYFLLYELENHLLVEEEFGDFIRVQDEVKLHQVSTVFNKTRNFLSKSLAIASFKFENINKEDDFQKPDLSDFSPLESVEVNIESSLNIRNKRVVASDIEKILVHQFKHEEYSEQTLNQLIVGFIEMELYFSAAELIMKLPESSNKYYLSAQNFFNLSDFTSVILSVNEALGMYDFSSVESVPFYYLKARALESLNYEKDARQIYQLISETDPSFMSVKEKLR